MHFYCQSCRGKLEPPPCQSTPAAHQNLAQGFLPSSNSLSSGQTKWTSPPYSTWTGRTAHCHCSDDKIWHSLVIGQRLSFCNHRPEIIGKNEKNTNQNTATFNISPKSISKSELNTEQQHWELCHRESIIYLSKQISSCWWAWGSEGDTHLGGMIQLQWLCPLIATCKYLLHTMGDHSSST